VTQLELKLANSNSDSCRTTEHINSASFLTAPVKKVFFLSLLMTKPRHARMTDSLLSALELLIVNCWCNWLS